MPACLMCGQCCHVLLKDGSIKKCRHLVHLKNGKTLCRVYKKRLGVRIVGEWFCNWRVDTTFDFEGCPFNTNKPVLNVKTGEVTENESIKDC